MKISLLPILILFVIHLGTIESAWTQGGFEQYYYFNATNTVILCPIAYYQSNKDWYVEGRYNYEEMETISVYVGKVFSHDSRFSYSITPLLGGVAGRFKGASAGFNATMDYSSLYFNSQTQYTFSPDEQVDNFFFSWTEMGYQPWKWFFMGITSQMTYLFMEDQGLFEPGVVAGFVFGLWTIPIYSFNALDNKRYFVLGVNLNFKKLKNE